MAGDPAVDLMNQPPGKREFPGERQRTGPPDEAGEVNDCMSASKDFAAMGNDFHFLRTLAGVEAEAGLDPRFLQGGEAETSPHEARPDASKPATAERAGAVKE